MWQRMIKDAQGGDMAATTEWYKGLAGWIQKREHADLMIGKWQEKREAAEAEIARMTAEAQAQGYGAPEQAPEQGQE